jgi:4-coumarate--CoA ligase
VKRDAQDRIHYLDRLKEMIKVKGLQVAATEVEDTLLDHPQDLVRDACVAGVDNGRGDGSLFVRAWVVLTDTGKKQGEEDTVGRKLDDWVRSRLSKHKWLSGGIEVVDSVSSVGRPSAMMLTRNIDTKDTIWQDAETRDAGSIPHSNEEGRKTKDLEWLCLPFALLVYG